MKEFVLSNSKRLFLGAALLACFALSGFFSGCTFDAEHNRAHWESFKQDARESHRFIDKTFFNYDWNDPDNWYIEQ